MKKGLQAFSLLGGVVFFSVVVGIAVSRNERVRQEIDAQIQTFLKTTRSVLAQYQQIAQKIGAVSDDLKSVKRKDNIEGPKLLSAADRYTLAWEQAEQVLGQGR